MYTFWLLKLPLIWIFWPFKHCFDIDIFGFEKSLFTMATNLAILSKKLATFYSEHLVTLKIWNSVYISPIILPFLPLVVKG